MIFFKIKNRLLELPDTTEVVNKQIETLKNNFQNLKDLIDNVQREIQATNNVQEFERQIFQNFFYSFNKFRELESINNWIISSRDARERPLRVYKKNIRAEERKHSAFRNELKVDNLELIDSILFRFMVLDLMILAKKLRI